VRADLHKLQKVTGPTGAPRFVADSDGSGHADRAWACFLALSAGSQGAGAIGYTPALRHPRGFDNLAASALAGRGLQMRADAQYAGGDGALPEAGCAW